MTQQFDFTRLKFDDRQEFLRHVGDFRNPDLVIAPDGFPYLYRWHIIPRASTPEQGSNLYFHVQVNDDPERPLHNHPWDNMSVILTGGYKETMCMSEGEPSPDATSIFIRQKGDVIFRRARWSHRLTMLRGEDYAMTLFSTGPKVNSWGFWYPAGFRPYQEVTVLKDGVSVHVKGSDAQGGMA